MWFLIKEGISGFKSARLASFMAILVIATALFFNGIFYITLSRINNYASTLKRNFVVQFFIAPTIKNSTKKIINRIGSDNTVAEIKYISPDSALAEMSEALEIPLQAVLKKNPLPPTLKVYIKPEYVQSMFINNFVAKYSAQKEFIDIQYPKTKLKLLDKYGTAVFMLLTSLGLLFLLSSILLISYSLKITIHGKQKYIVLTRLMGGTTFHIRFPFFVEGLLEGIVGASIASALLMTIEKAFIKLSLITTPFHPNIYPLLLATGLIIGMVGSQIALKKYLFLDEELL